MTRFPGCRLCRGVIEIYNSQSESNWSVRMKLFIYSLGCWGHQKLKPMQSTQDFQTTKKKNNLAVIGDVIPH